MSPPAEKLLPRPESTMTRTAGSWPRSRKVSASSSIMASFSALCTAGRFIHTQATEPALSSSRVGSGINEFSHAEHAEACRLDGCVLRGGETQGQHLPRVKRIDDAIVPQARGCVVWIALLFILVANRPLELLFLFAAPIFALGFESVAAHARQRVGGLPAANQGGAQLGPLTKKGGRIRPPPHPIFPRPEPAADEHGEFRDARAGHGHYHFGAVFGNAAV